LKYIIFGGEMLKKTDLVNFSKYFKSNIKMINMYGLTEGSVHVTYNKVDSENNNLVGKALNNYQTYILNQYQKLQPIGVPGELYISGDGLARGYINDKQKTREVFLPHPFKKDTRIYKTGDLAKMHPDGNIEILGRVDHQIKIRGMRIEPGEIEANLKKHKNIKDVVVIVKENKKDNDKYLVAYYILEKKNKKETIKQINKEKEELKSKLKRILPDYMIPAYFIRLDKFPLNQNGKLDRLNLPEPKEKDLDKNKYITPKTEIEKKVAKIWQEVLGVKKISRNDNFFNLGGHSLKAIQVLSRINSQFKIDLGLKEIFENQELSGLSLSIRNKLIILAKIKIDYVN
jgi:surfactin family lipopeptide synthetase A